VSRSGATPLPEIPRIALRGRARDALSSLSALIQTYFTDQRGQPIRLSAGQRAACAAVEAGVFGAGFVGAGLEMARGHGKSMIMKCLIILGFLRSFYAPDLGGVRYAAILTSGMLYKQFSADLAAILTGSGAPLVKGAGGVPLLHLDFFIRPGQDYPIRRHTHLRLWGVQERIAFIGDWHHPVSVSVRGMTGGSGSVRGMTRGVQRPDLLIVDDPMRDSEAANPTITEKIKSFVRDALIPAGEPGARIAFFGTPFNEQDLITSVCGNAATPPSGAWGAISSAVLPAVHPVSGALLAPAIWTPEMLAERRAAVGSLAYSREYLLLPRDAGMRHFDRAWIERWTGDAPAQTPDGRRLRRVMYLDPSLGRSKKSDAAAIVVLDYETAARTAWVRHVESVRLRSQDLVKKHLDVWEAWRPDTHAVEDEGAQELLIPTFQTEAAARGLPAAAIPRLLSVGGVAKVVRIRRLSALVEFGRIRWARGGQHAVLRARLEGWGGTPDEADDEPDALEGAMRLAEGGGVDGLLSQWKGLTPGRR